MFIFLVSLVVCRGVAVSESPYLPTHPFTPRCQSDSPCLFREIAIPGYTIGYHFPGKSRNVMLCQEKSTLKTYVCKLAMLPAWMQSLPIECRVFEKLAISPHDSIINLHELKKMGVVHGRNTFVEIMDYYSPTDGWVDLFDYTDTIDYKSASTKEINGIFQRVAKGIFHLFNLNVSHSDIKTENILINTFSKEIRIIDFDLAQPIRGHKSTAFSGTPIFYSPEIVKRIPYSLEKNEVWQLGCLLYVLYFIDFPFNDNNEILNLNLRLKISLEARAIPTHIAKFLRMMLSKEENDRPTLAQVYDFLPSLDHEYLSPVTKISSDTKEDPSLDVDVEYSPMDELLGDPRVGKITKYDLFDDKDPSRVGYRSAIKVDSRVGKMKKDSPAKKPSLRGIGRLGLGRFFRGPRKKE